MTDLFRWLVVAASVGHQPEKLGLEAIGRQPGHSHGTLEHSTKPLNAQMGTCDKQ